MARAPVSTDAHLAPDAVPRVNVLDSKLSLFGADAAAYVNSLTEPFECLPLVCEGESKIVRQLTPTLVAIKLKPTLFSYKADRYGVVPGTEEYRLRVSNVLWQRLEAGG